MRQCLIGRTSEVAGRRLISLHILEDNGVMALSRLSIQHAISEPQLAAEINCAIENTSGATVSSGDYVCCGAFGKIAILNEAGLRLRRNELIRLAEHEAMSTIRRARTMSGFRWLVGRD